MEKNTVRIYSTSTCPYCIRAKEFLKKNKVQFSDINVAENDKGAEEMFEKSGQMGVPVLEINGKIIVGFDEEEMRSALGL